MLPLLSLVWYSIEALHYLVMSQIWVIREFSGMAGTGSSPAGMLLSIADLPCNVRFTLPHFLPRKCARSVWYVACFIVKLYLIIIFQAGITLSFDLIRWDISFLKTGIKILKKWTVALVGIRMWSLTVLNSISCCYPAAYGIESQALPCRACRQSGYDRPKLIRSKSFNREQQLAG